jgi:hypothetical protein
MSDWKTTEVFIARSSAQHSAYAVGVAIAALGNRKDDGWTFASLDRIALLAHLDDRGTANLAIRELVELGELEYVPGKSRYSPSRYRICTEVLEAGVDRFRCSLTTPAVKEIAYYGEGGQIVRGMARVTAGEAQTLISPSTMGDSPTADHGANPYGDHGAIPHGDHAVFPDSPYGNSRRDHGENPASPWGNSTRSIKNRSANRSIDQRSDQSARAEEPRAGSPAESWHRTEEDDDGALKTSLEACRRVVGSSAGEEQ